MQMLLGVRSVPIDGSHATPAAASRSCCLLFLEGLKHAKHAHVSMLSIRHDYTATDVM